MAEVARRLRDYLSDHRDGRTRATPSNYLDWWDKVSVPGEYRVTLRRGEVEPDVGKYLGGGGPDLGVVLRSRRRRLRPLPGRPRTPTGRSGTTPSPARSAGSSATR